MLKEGDRVRLLKNKIIIQEEFGRAELGTVREATADLVAIELDRDWDDIPGSRGMTGGKWGVTEWENQFVWVIDDFCDHKDWDNPEVDIDVRVMLDKTDTVFVIEPSGTHVEIGVSDLAAIEFISEAVDDKMRSNNGSAFAAQPDPEGDMIKANAVVLIARLRQGATS